MASTTLDPVRPVPLHPVHAFFLAGTVPLFLGAVLSDWAYHDTAEIQWSNFASWLIAGGLVFGAVALLCAFIALTRTDRTRGARFGEFLLLLATWVLGFIDAFVHAGDAWTIMPAGLTLSVVVLLLAIAATWLGFARYRRGALP